MRLFVYVYTIDFTQKYVEIIIYFIYTYQCNKSRDFLLHNTNTQSRLTVLIQERICK